MAGNSKALQLLGPKVRGHRARRHADRGLRTCGNALRPDLPGEKTGATDVPIVSSGGTSRRAAGMALPPGWHALRCRDNEAASAVGRGAL